MGQEGRSADSSMCELSDLAAPGTPSWRRVLPLGRVLPPGGSLLLVIAILGWNFPDQERHTLPRSTSRTFGSALLAAHLSLAPAQPGLSLSLVSMTVTMNDYE